MRIVSNQERGRSSEAPQEHCPWVVIAFVALSAPLFALLSWDHDPTLRTYMSVSRRYSVPIVGIEIAMIVMAILRGHSLAAVARSWHKSTIAAVLALACIALGTALFVATALPEAIVRTYCWVVHLLFGMAIFSIYRAHRNLAARTWQAICAGLVLYVAILAVFVATIPDPDNFDWVYLRLAVTNVRQAGFYSAVGGSAALALAILSKGRAGYWAAISSASILIGLSFWSGTRSSLLAIFASLLVCAILLPSLRTPRAAGAAIMAFAGGAMLSLAHLPPSPAYGLIRTFRDSVRYDADRVSGGRLLAWKGTIREIKKRPIFGYGESQFRTVVPESQGIYNHPHNSILQILLQWGLVGAACFFGLIAMMWIRMLSAVRRDPEYHLAAFLLVNTLLALSLIEGSLYHPYPVMMMAFAAAISFGISTQSVRGVTPSPAGDK